MNELKKFDIASSVTDSLIELFDMMLSMQLELADNDACQDLEANRIVASVSLAGRVTGSITIHISDEFSRIMTAAMLGVEPEEVREAEDIKDVISEICNIVGGNLKSNFCDAGLTCELSTPSFTSGNDFIIESLNTDRHEHYNFSYKQHHILVEVGVRVNDAADVSEPAKPEPEIQYEPVDIGDIENFDIKTHLIESLIELFDTMLSMGLEQSEKNLKSTLDGKRIVGSVSLIGPLWGASISM